MSSFFTYAIAPSLGCERPEKPEYGWVNYRYTTAGSRAWFYCNTGYTRIGTAVCTCSSSGMWEPEIPTCRRKKVVMYMCRVDLN